MLLEPASAVTRFSALPESPSLRTSRSSLKHDPFKRRYRLQSTDPGRYASEGSITVVDLLVPTSGGRFETAAAKARDAADALQHGMTVNEAIAKFGLKDTKKTSGEEFYFAARLHLGPELFTAASLLKSGQTSLPVRSADGYHVLVASQNTPPVKRNFQEAREQVLTDYKNEAEAKLQANEEKFLIGRADILVADRYRKYLP